MDAAQSYAGGVILALDVATRTGVAWGEPGEKPKLLTVNFGRPLLGFEAPTGQSDGALFARAFIWIKTFEIMRKPFLIVIEGLVPQYDKTIQCGLWAIFHAVAAAKGIPVIVAPISTWRAFVLGSGKLKKDEAKTRAIATCTRLGWEPKGHDEAEAACIWLWGCAQVAPERAQRAEPLFLGKGAA
jgi:hypothetical protein